MGGGGGGGDDDKFVTLYVEGVRPGVCEEPAISHEASFGRRYDQVH